jgi:hypothetical protein
MDHLTAAELEIGLDVVRRAPRDAGTLEMIVCRPAEEERRVLDEGKLTLEEGLVGDNWRTRGGPDGSPDPEAQITVMNSRFTDLVARRRDRWPLAGDQLYVDLDLSVELLPPGNRLAIGAAVIEVSAPPHTGCAKFVARFGRDALRLANSQTGLGLRLRGLNAKVIVPGTIHVGDAVEKL